MNKTMLPSVLQHVPLFSSLAQEELQELAQFTFETRLKKGEVLFNRGELPKVMHMVITGKVKLAIPSPDGMERVIAIIPQGEGFGLAILLQDAPYPVTAEAVEDSLIVGIEKVQVMKMADRHPEIWHEMCKIMSTRLTHLVQDIENCTLRASTQRVACYLSRQLPQNSHGTQEVALPASKQVVASALNLAPETFSRALHDLSSHGLIKVKGRTITVVDVAKLQKFAA
jgi:CRP/FNR family transcriptional regulator, dissimilatory nitrate respiration regulator